MINRGMISHPRLSYERDGFSHKQRIVNYTQKSVLHCINIYYLHDLSLLMHYYVQVNNMSYDQKSGLQRVTGFLLVSSPMCDFWIVSYKYSTYVIHES